MPRPWPSQNSATRKRYDYKVLFLSRQNVARGQLAEALLRHESKGAFGSFSAGLEPGPVIHPMTYAVLSEIGVPLGHQRPKATLELAGEGFDLVIVLDADTWRQCPSWAGTTTILWSYADPVVAPEAHGERLKIFRRLRDNLMRRFNRLAASPLERMGQTALDLADFRG